MRILVCTELLSPYRVDWFDELSRYASVDILVLKESSEGRDKNWLSKRPRACAYRMMSGRSLPGIGKLSFSFVKHVRENAESYDLILLDGYGFATQAINLLFLRKQAIPVVINVDGLIDNYDSKLKDLVKKRLFCERFFFLCGSSRADEVLMKYGVQKDRIFHHPFTSLTEKDILKVPPTAAEKESIKAELGIRGERILLSVGQFIRRKGFDVLVEAFAGLDEKADLYIVGGKPTEEYTELVDRLGIGGSVHFIDFCEKSVLARYYQASDLFVLPTREDIWGLVINEAMANGLPVISTDQCMAALDLVKSGVNGYIVPSEDAAALREKMQYLLRNEQALRQFGENSLQIIHAYTIEKMAEMDYKLFCAMIGKRKDGQWH